MRIVIALGAQTEAMIGYVIEQELGNLLPAEQPIATVLTMIEVDRDDPAFDHPTKPIGPVYDRETAERLKAARGCAIAPDGDKYRRVQLDAELLVIATDVDGVYTDWGTPHQARLGQVTPDELAGMDLPAGSMGPKVQAACNFARNTGNEAAIGSLTDITKH